jgi:signal transduction histidine kinase
MYPQNDIPPIEQLNSLNEVRNLLMQCQNVEEVVCEALKQARNKLNVQVTSIFLFSKEGTIKRIGIDGIDKHGNPIDNTWFSDEQYEPGASFSGKAIPNSKSKSGFGEPQWSNNLVTDFTMDEATKNHYLEKLGDLKCGISVPLNGRYRTFGAIEVLNKIGGEFSRDDVYWLMIIATSVANFISDFRRRKELDVFTQLTQKLVAVEVIDREFDLQRIYDFVVEKITEEYTPYKACILRIVNENEDLEFKAWHATQDISLQEQRLDVPKKAASGIVKAVYKTREPIFIEDIDRNIEQFYNQKWIGLNNIKSYACIPLLVKNKVFGTISVFIGYYHKFSTNHEYFLRNIAFFTAAIVARVRLIDEFRKVSQERDEARDGILSAVRFARSDYFLQGILHEYKNDLLAFHEILITILDGIHIRKTEYSIHEKMNWIKQRVADIQKEFTPATSAPVNINDIVKEIVRCFSGLSNKTIQIVAKYENKMPVISINSSQIKDIVFNLVSNAVRAVQKANRKLGKISIETSLVTSDRIDYIQISIEDNGIGIKNELNEKIFEKGFTTSDVERGTGMGLFLAREIIQNYGGKIYFDSTVGKGTKFFIKIPFKRYLV